MEPLRRRVQMKRDNAEQTRRMAQAAIVKAKTPDAVKIANIGVIRAQIIRDTLDWVLAEIDASCENHAGCACAQYEEEGDATA